MDNDQTVIRPADQQHQQQAKVESSTGTPKSGTTSSRPDQKAGRTFKYDKSYWSFDFDSPNFACQERVFDDLGQPLLVNAFQGFNNCILAYGQTGSGKTYSMMGTADDPGIIPRICDSLFQKIAGLSSKSHKFTVEVSYFEIYNERVRDLLNPNNKGNLRIREHPLLGPYVEDLSKLIVGSFPEIQELMNEGNKTRTVAATNMNETSSRSHAVFTLLLTQIMHDDETNLDTEKVSRISLVDLAGSERASSTGATGVRLKEGSEINKSLSALGRVIRTLADLSSKKEKDSVIPYRDSALTWILKDSLGGNSLTAMIATISPADINYDETLSTLRYADSAKRIKNHAVINEDPNAKIIRELKQELSLLRSKLETAGSSLTNPDQSSSDVVTVTTSDGTVRQVSRAEITEQLSSSEKLFKELNTTWEERLAQTQEIHRQREAALDELGINIEKGFVGVRTPKNIPYLVNLSDDPLLAECLVYNIKPGKTEVGNADVSTKAQIRLHGSKISKNHCSFDNVDDVVTIIPHAQASIIINGLRISEPKRLHTGDRIILGDFHIFRFNHPREALKERHGVRRRAKPMSPIRTNSNNVDEGVEEIDVTVSEVASTLDDESSGLGATLSQKDDALGDWSFARFEAAKSILGPDVSANLSATTDEELDRLFEEMQRLRSLRKGRPESSMSFYETDGDSFMSVGTSSVLSFRKLQDAAGFDSEDPFLSAKPLDESPSKSESLKLKLNQARSDIRNRLEGQRLDFEAKLRANTNRSPTRSPLRKSKVQHDDEFSDRQVLLARSVLQVWQKNVSVRLSESLFRHAMLLKEAQILSNELSRSIRFQFAIVDDSYLEVSPYDMMLNEFEPEEDLALIKATKPCAAVRVMDGINNVLKIYSFAKLESCVKLIRNIYNEAPSYADLHDRDNFQVKDPFSEKFNQQYTCIGDAYVPLTEIIVGRNFPFSIDITSPHTLSVIGLIDGELQPVFASQDSIPSTVLVNLKCINGFSEREFSEVHVQMFMIGLDGFLDGISTSQTVSGFGDGSVNFNTSHGVRLNDIIRHGSNWCLDIPVLRIKVFAKISSVHLEKLLSWDDMQETESNVVEKRPRFEPAIDVSGLPLHHDAFVRIEILEMSDSGQYEPVDIVQDHPDGKGLFQFHIGVQRQIRLSIRHSSGDTFEWNDIREVSVSNVRMMDAQGRLLEAQSKVDKVVLRRIGRPKTIAQADGTRTVTVLAQWDSSAHNSAYLDRATNVHEKFVISLSWSVMTAAITMPAEFSTNLVGRMIRRSSRGPSLFALLFTGNRIAHSYVGLFQVQLRSLKTADSRQLNIKESYISGEEYLGVWKPRSTALVKEFQDCVKQRWQNAALSVTQSVLDRVKLDEVNVPVDAEFDERQVSLLQKCLTLWRHKPQEDSTVKPVGQSRLMTKPPTKYVADVRQIQKSTHVIKEGHAWMPDNAMYKWERRYLELRRPYLHVYGADEMEEKYAINVTQCRIGYQPELAPGLLNKANVFAVYTEFGTHLIAVRSHVELSNWVMKLGQDFANA
ncbi:hypothetical protein V1514DRAFT_275597 [Lipomyces japonicus]|uniref:uncharacterized protein n=1 Tax=Lipomyces japonicus TaxID=56871 RepID=UPI0034CED70E